jgi:transposase
LCETPDSVTDHAPAHCAGCGHTFTSATASDLIGSYDAVDLPTVLPVVARHRRLARCCPQCGVVTKGPVPAAAIGTPFGPNIRALTFYLKQFQLFSYVRLQGMYRDVFGLAISQGALMNILQRGSAAFEAGKAGIVTRLRSADAVASDETGVRIEGVNAQHWVFLSRTAVVHEAAFSRGAQVVREMMGKHRPRYWTSDRYSAQQGHSQFHQTCLAHLARDIAYAVEAVDGPTPLALKLWMGRVFALARDQRNLAPGTVQRKRRALERSLDAILATPTDCDITGKLIGKIARARDQLLTFLDAPDLLEPTNNAAERALRPAVIHRKVTNGFRAFWAAKADAAVRTVVDTARLQGISPLQAITQTIA